MIYVRPLTDDERRLLRQLARTEVGRVSERMHMVLLSSRAYPVPQIAAIFACDEATVRTWLGRFEAEGIDGLRGRPRAGRPRKADPPVRATLDQALTQPPITGGSLAGYWTVAMLVAHLAAVAGHQLSASTVRRTLRALAFRWRRPRHVLPRDPDAAAKRWALADQIWQATADTVILCQDESDVHLLPVLRAMWMRVGQQVRIPTPGGNRKRTVFGALNLESGQWTYALTARKRAVEFVAFLEQVGLAYPERPLLVIVDNASIHTAKLVQAWLVDHPQVTLGYLPTYSGHQYNPVEKVWWRLKDQVAANRLHGSLEALEEAVHAFCTSFTPVDALRLAA